MGDRVPVFSRLRELSRQVFLDLQQLVYLDVRLGRGQLGVYSGVETTVELTSDTL